MPLQKLFIPSTRAKYIVKENYWPLVVKAKKSKFASNQCEGAYRTGVASVLTAVIYTSVDRATKILTDAFMGGKRGFMTGMLIMGIIKETKDFNVVSECLTCEQC